MCGNTLVVYFLGRLQNCVELFSESRSNTELHFQDFHSKHTQSVMTEDIAQLKLLTIGDSGK